MPGTEGLGDLVLGGFIAVPGFGPGSDAPTATHVETVGAQGLGSDVTVTLSDVDAGDLLVAMFGGNAATSDQPHDIDWPVGWTLLHHYQSDDSRIGYFDVYWKRAEVGDTSLALHGNEPFSDLGDCRLVVSRYANAGDPVDSAAFDNTGASANPGLPSVFPTEPGSPVLLYVAVLHQPDYAPALDDSYVQRFNEQTGGGNRQSWQVWDRIEDVAEDEYAPDADWADAGAETFWDIVHVAFGPVDTATISARFTLDVDPVTFVVVITDTSTGEITDWLWDFGDSVSSTDPGPFTRTYTEGIYNVFLTVSGPAGSDTYSLTFSVGTPLGDTEPAGPILEIWVPDPDGDKWDVAEWDVATWADSRWVDVTPQGVDVDWSWGVDDADAGILAATAADRCQVATYDPERILDPGNPSSPYAPYLAGGTPIRLNHRGSVIRTGIIDNVSYSYESKSGVIDASSDVSRAARAEVPVGTDLPSTLRAMMAAAVDAAGLAMPFVETSGFFDDPTITEPDTTEPESVWRHITRAAQEVLWIVYLDRHRTLQTRPYQEPVASGKVIAAPFLFDVIATSNDNELYSVIRALDPDEVTVVERAATPTPAYGKVVFERRVPTIDPDVWAEVVLADRSERRVRYAPGDILPQTAAQVDYLASVEHGDLITVDWPAATITGVVLAQRVRVRALRIGVYRWKWNLYLASTPEDF